MIGKYNLLLATHTSYMVIVCIITNTTLFCMESTKLQEELNTELYTLVNENSEDATDDIKNLLAQGARPDWIEQNSGETALHKVVYYRKSNILRLLLSDITNINIPASDGQTPLHRAMVTHMPTTISLSQAIHNGNDTERNPLLQRTLDIVALLLQFGADPCYKDLKEKTPINIADDNKKDEEKNLCTNSIALLPHLHKAIATGNKEELLKWITPKEAPVHYIEEKTANNTLLHEAALLNKEPWLAKILICNGARINQQNNKGQTALHIASQQKKKQMVIYLLFCCKGIDLSLTDQEGNTALPSWIANGWQGMLFELIKAGYTLQQEAQESKK